MERIYTYKNDVENSLNEIRIHNHIARYQLIKKYCYGNVLDIACGIGYGSYLLSNNPDIKEIVGVDIDPDSIEFAKHEYTTEKTTFINDSIENYSMRHDVLLSLETLEHIEDLKAFRDMVVRVDPSILIVSFPNKKSTHFNPFHKHDLHDQDVVNLFDNFILVRTELQPDISILIFVKKPKYTPSHIFSRLF